MISNSLAKEATAPKEDEDTFDTFEDDSFDHVDAAMDDMDTSDKAGHSLPGP